MRRRDLFLAVGAVLASRPNANAAASIRLGILAPRPAPSANDLVFLRALRELGHVEGNNFSLAFRGIADDPRRLRELADELVALNPAVIFAAGSEASQAAIAATAMIPIVTASSNPVGVGIVDGLARPQANVTGISFMSNETTAKQMQLLKEIIPSLSRVAVIWDPEDPGAATATDQAVSAAGTLAFTAHVLEARTDADLEPRVDAAARLGAGALIFIPAPLMTDNAKTLAELALRDRLPALSNNLAFTKSGGLLSYGSDIADGYRRAAGYVDRILKGARPTELPVDQPTKFILAINQKTAKTLGLAVPPILLAQADEVIE